MTAKKANNKISEMSIRAYAKINLSIDVLGKRPDGYHEVRMVMHQIDLWDMVTVGIEADDRMPRISLTCSRADLPCDRTNLAWRAAELILADYAGRKHESLRININIQKNIPVAAGLAGGSADGAAVLHALNSLLGLGLSFSELAALGVKLGADVPFCLMGQAAANPAPGHLPAANPGAVPACAPADVSVCAEAVGIGEILTPLPPLDAWVLLSKPPIAVSTKEVYGALRLNEIERHPDTDALIENLKAGRHIAMYKNMYNVLEKPCGLLYPVTMYTKNTMQTADPAIKVMMSGSGPTVFALSADKKKLAQMYAKMKLLNPETYLIQTILLREEALEMRSECVKPDNSKS